MYRHSLFFLFLLFSLAVSAQDAPPLSTTSDEVIVTGARYARTLAESPQHVTIIDSAAVARAPSLAQLLNEQAGIVVNGAYSNYGKDRSIFLRNGANQYTLILVDGQPLIDPSSLGGAVDLRLLSLEGVERIEILRGARSLLYGSDAVAGVINLVTSSGGQGSEYEKGNSPLPFRINLRAAAERYSTYTGTAAIAGSTEKLDYRLGYDYFTTDGISEAEPMDETTEDFNRDGSARRTVYGNLTWRPTESLTIRPALRRAIFTGDYDRGAFTDAENEYRNDLWLPSLAVNYRQATWELGGRYNYAATDRVFDDAAFGESIYKGRAQQGDVFYNYLPSEAFSLTVGGQVRHESLATEAETPTVTNISPYLQANLNVAERLLLEGGYRYNHHSVFGGQSNGSLAVGYRHTDRVSSRLSVGSAFQSPTLDQLYGPFGANAELQPQVSTSYEAGLRVQSRRGERRATVTVFQRQIDQVVTYDGTLGYQNQDELRDRGVEVEGFTDLSARFRLDGNFTYVKGQLRSPDGSGGTTESDEFYRRPRTTGLLGLTYRANQAFSARLTAAYTGERPDIYYDANFSPVTLDLDPYLIVNLYAEYKLLENRNLSLFAEIRNLTDTDFTEVSGYSTLGITPRLGVAWTY
ncbi:TonB-dependent receptor plug domain-containing protein [Lewinella sp. IMCC34191]|uniref:TonB-dependent receptor plug domain-containing protein n=1 Tax=Lewinella sp. IMCC34191 TaxID=2259172 RepID=UPI000E22F66B|nr:TonB-dependent receptor [Lewinella sp. IMCC34191]